MKSTQLNCAQLFVCMLKNNTKVRIHQGGRVSQQTKRARLLCNPGGDPLPSGSMKAAHRSGSVSALSGPSHQDSRLAVACGSAPQLVGRAGRKGGPARDFLSRCESPIRSTSCISLPTIRRAGMRPKIKPHLSSS